MTDELSFNPPTDRQKVRRDIAFALLLRWFPPLHDISLGSPVKGSARIDLEVLTKAAWEVADMFLAAGETSITPVDCGDYPARPAK